MQWSTATPMLVAVSYPAVVSHGNELYVIGGTCRGQPTSFVQVYSEATGTWKYGAGLGTGRCEAAAVVVSLPFGGQNHQ
ncbi:hypothetical protein Y032_0062g3361 [Ancylostoma ceylanicum]|uniref:Kelch repeat protein n=1 Tax=Ancylostoma ceylanicum TaxID=53326 RepID=A0A016U3E3_9BILA|nr:hypothetical protein Y032_0062g3361 [Ancylostoma ceylanicum]